MVVAAPRIMRSRALPNSPQPKFPAYSIRSMLSLRPFQPFHPSRPGKMGQTIWWKDFARPNAGRFVTREVEKNVDGKPNVVNGRDRSGVVNITSPCQLTDCSTSEPLPSCRWRLPPDPEFAKVGGLEKLFGICCKFWLFRRYWSDSLFRGTLQARSPAA